MSSKKPLQGSGTANRAAVAKMCPQGHTFYKSSDCPVCPQCAAEGRPEAGFMAALSAPARRALETLGIVTAADLSRFTEKELLALHGFGRASLPILRQALAKDGLQFREPITVKSKNH